MQFDAVAETVNVMRKLFERRNWLLGAPYMASIFLLIVIVLILIAAFFGSTILHAIASGHPEDYQPTQFDFVRFAVAYTIAIIAFFFVSAFVYGWTLAAAEPVWRGGDPAFDRGFNRAAQKLLTLVAFTILIALMAIVSIITIVGPIVIAFLSIYGTAFILFEDMSATQAIGASFKLASEQVAPTIVLVLAFIVVGFGGFMVMFFLSLVPFVGWLAQIAFNWLFSAYVALGVLRFYELLKVGGPTIPIVPKTSV